MLHHEIMPYHSNLRFVVLDLRFGAFVPEYFFSDCCVPRSVSLLGLNSIYRQRHTRRCRRKADEIHSALSQQQR